MGNNQCIKYKVYTIAALTAFSELAQADESDPSEQVKKLQRMVEQLQQQRLEQDKQMDLLTKELVGVENQLSQSKIVKAEEKAAVRAHQYSPILKMALPLKTTVVIGNFQSTVVYRLITVTFILMKMQPIRLVYAAHVWVARSLSIKIMQPAWKVNILVVAQRLPMAIST